MLMDTMRSRARREAPTPHAHALDEPHWAIWQAIRHLFPAHAMADQTDHGCILISWSLAGRRAAAHFAAPIIIDIEHGLLLALWTCEPGQREEIAREQEPVVRAHLAHYDPHSRIPTCGVIVLGE